MHTTPPQAKMPLKATIPIHFYTFQLHIHHIYNLEDILWNFALEFRPNDTQLDSTARSLSAALPWPAACRAV